LLQACVTFMYIRVERGRQRELWFSIHSLKKRITSFGQPLSLISWQSLNDLA